MNRYLLLSLTLVGVILAGAGGCGRVSGQTRVRVGYLPITDHLPIIAAAGHDSPNLKIEPVRFSSWPEAAEALRAGAIDAAFLLAPMAINLAAAGAPIEAVMLGHRNGSALVSGRDSGIAGPQDLRGKTVAIPSRFSAHNLLLNRYLEANGVDVAAVRVLEMPPTEMVNGIATGRIDAFIVAEPFCAQAELDGRADLLVLSREIEPDHICCVLNVRKELLSEHPEAVAQLVAAFRAAGERADHMPEEVLEDAAKYLRQKAKPLRKVVASDRVTYRELDIRQSDFEHVADQMRKLGLLPREPDWNSYLGTGFEASASGEHE